MQCEDQKDVAWLQDIVASFESPIPGTHLVVKQQKDIPRRVKSGVFLPDCNEQIGTIHRLLTAQNKSYRVNRWSLYHVERQEGEPPGAFLILGIPADEIPAILAKGRRLCYKLGNAYIRFFGSSGLRDTPPDPAEAATETRAASDPPVGRQGESAGRELETGAPLSTASRPPQAARQVEADKPTVTQHSSAEKPRQDGTSACLHTPDTDTGIGDLVEEIAQLMDRDSPLRTDGEASSPLRSSSPN